MKTLEERLAEARKSYEADIERAHLQEAMKESLAEIGIAQEPRLVQYPLFGSDGSWLFEPKQSNAENVNRHILTALLLRFPPVELFKVKDGCCSFRPSKPERGEITEVAPVKIDIDVFQKHTAEFEWYANFQDKLWKFGFKLPLHTCDLGKLDLRANYYGNSDKVASYDVCQFIPRPELKARVIRWASGSPEYPNSFTLYWDLEKAPDFLGLVKL